MSFVQPAGSPFGVAFGPVSGAVGDFNLDGKPDVAVACISFNSVTILLGNGNGGFAQPAGSPVNAGLDPISVAAGDFNLDGKPDLAVANQNDRVTVLLGNGGGGFTQPTGSPFTAGTGPRSVAIGDFNLDGKPDIAVANRGSGDVTILMGNGSGGFTQSAVSVGTGFGPFFIAVGDFDVNGKPDLAVANENASSVSILLGNGAGGFTQPAGSPIGTGSFPRSLAVGDFNLDAKPDLVVSNGGDNVTILLGNGSGGFTEPAGSPVGAGTFPLSVVVGDFNLDGKPDLAVASDGSNDVTLLLGNGGGGFTEPAGSPIVAGPVTRFVTVGDFNLDGKPDLAVSNDATNIRIQLNACDAFPCSGIGFMQPAGSPVGAGDGPLSVAVGDFNLDGKLDLAVANFRSNNVTILLGNGSGGFSQPAGSPVGAETDPLSVTAGDFNLDGKPDLATANQGSNNVTILLGNGSGGFTQPAGSPVGTGSSPTSVAVGDFNLDGKPDLVVANNGSANVTILLGDGSGGFTQAAGSPVGTGISPISAAVGDFNLDGKPDVAVANFAAFNVTILLGNGSGGFTQAAGSPVGTASFPFSIAAGDFNRDGKPDLATANENNNVTILLGNGSGGFTQPAGSPVGAGTNPSSLASGDFDLDGKPDLAVANVNSNNVTILLGNGSGGFTQPAGSPVGAGTNPFSVAVGDFNRDGKPDLTTANLTSNNVTIQLNTCNTLPCIQDETNGNFMFFDSQTGDYLFVVCSQGIQVSGRGTIKRSADGCTITLTHLGPNQKTVKASINTCNNTGQATLTMVVNKRATIFSIKDLDTTNNTCACP